MYSHTDGARQKLLRPDAALKHVRSTARAVGFSIATRTPVRYRILNGVRETLSNFGYGFRTRQRFGSRARPVKFWPNSADDELRNCDQPLSYCVALHRTYENMTDPTSVCGSFGVKSRMHDPVYKVTVRGVELHEVSDYIVTLTPGGSLYGVVTRTRVWVFTIIFSFSHSVRYKLCLKRFSSQNQNATRRCFYRYAYYTISCAKLFQS
jgi:hypothetical protein